MVKILSRIGMLCHFTSVWKGLYADHGCVNIFKNVDTDICVRSFNKKGAWTWV